MEFNVNLYCYWRFSFRSSKTFFKMTKIFLTTFDFCKMCKNLPNKKSFTKNDRIIQNMISKKANPENFYSENNTKIFESNVTVLN